MSGVNFSASTAERNLIRQQRAKWRGSRVGLSRIKRRTMPSIRFGLKWRRPYLTVSGFCEIDISQQYTCNNAVVSLGNIDSQEEVGFCAFPRGGE